MWLASKDRQTDGREMAAIIPEPFFSTAGVCQRALMSACIVTGDPTDIGTCDPAVFRLSGDDGYEIRDPVRRVVIVVVVWYVCPRLPSFDPLIPVREREP